MRVSHECIICAIDFDIHDVHYVEQVSWCRVFGV